MRLRVRTLGSEECEVSVQPEETVKDLKKKIEALLPRMQADKQKLVHAGRVLEDFQKISNYPQIKENERLVVLVTKQVASSTPAAAANPAAAAAAAAPAAATAAAAPATSAAPAAEPAAESAAASPAADAAAPAAATPATAEQQQQQTSNVVNESAAMLATGQQLQDSIRSLEEMGFPSEMVRVALRAAFNNPDRAVEYLMNGIPENVLPPQAAAAPQGAPAGGPPVPVPAAGGPLPAAGGPPAAAGGSFADNPLAALRTHPTFLQVRQLVQANPEMLPQILQMIGSSNPDLLELITQNQEAFLELLQEGALRAGEARAEAQEGSTLLQGGVVQLSEQEMEAVDRLTALGFTRMQVAEAYIACDRNEEMAANYLFENLNDFTEEETQEEPPAS